MTARNVFPMLLAAAAASTALAASTATPWKAVATSGPVTARAEGASDPSWKKLARGERLAARSDVRTGRRGRATLTDEASVLMIDPASEVRLPSPGEPPRVVQSKGSVIYEVDGSKVRGFEVVTPFLVAGVKGTAFLVTVEERLAAVTVEHGVVAVRRDGSGDVIEVRAGETAIFDADGPAEIELIRSGDADASKTTQGSARAVAIAEREEHRLDRGYGAGIAASNADALLKDPSSALFDKSDSLLDAGSDRICSPIGSLDDPVRDVLDPVRDILDPVRLLPGDPPGGILDPVRDVFGGISELPIIPGR